MELKNEKTTTNDFGTRQLIEICDGDYSCVGELLTTLKESTKEGIDNIKLSLLKEEWDKISQYAHKICPGCLHVEAHKLYQLLKTVENNCRDKINIEQTADKIKEIDFESQKLFIWIDSELKKLNNYKT